MFVLRGWDKLIACGNNRRKSSDAPVFGGGGDGGGRRGGGGGGGGGGQSTSSHYWLRTGERCAVPRILEDAQLVVGIDATETWGQADGACVLLGDGGRVLGVIGSPGGLQRTDGVTLDVVDGREVFALSLARLSPSVRSLVFVASPRSGRLEPRSKPPQELFPREGSPSTSKPGEGLAFVGRVQDPRGATNAGAYNWETGAPDDAARKALVCKSLCWSRVQLPHDRANGAVVPWIIHCGPDDADGYGAKFRLEAVGQPLELPDMGGWKRVPLGAMAFMQPHLARLQASGQRSGHEDEMPTGEESTWFARSPWLSPRANRPGTQAGSSRDSDSEDLEEETAELMRVLQTANRYAQEKWKEAEREKMIVKELHQLLSATQASLRRTRGSAQALQYNLEAWRREALLSAQSGNPEKVVALLSRLPVQCVYPDDVVGKESTGSTSVPTGPPPGSSLRPKEDTLSDFGGGASFEGRGSAKSLEDPKCRYLTVNGGSPLRSRPPATTIGDIGPMDLAGEDPEETAGPPSRRSMPSAKGLGSGSSPGQRGLFLSAASGQRPQDGPEEGIDMTFEMPFKDLEDHAAFKTEILDALTKAGADRQDLLAKIKIKLREGSVVAELRGPAASIGALRRLPLESLELSSGLRPVKVDYNVATKGEGEAEEEESPAEPPMAPRNVSQDQRDSARGSGRDSARAKAGGATTGSAAASQSLKRDGQSAGRQFFEAEVGAEVKRLGFSFTTPSGNPLAVKTVTPGLWAEGVGVEVGDEILEINGQPTQGMGVDEVKKHVSQRPLGFKFGKKLQDETKRNNKEDALSPKNKGDLSTRSSRGNLSPRNSPRSPEELDQEKVNLEAELTARELKVGPDAPELEPLLQALARLYGRLEETDQQKAVLERSLQILSKGETAAERKKSAAVMKDLSMLYAKQDDHQHRQALLEQACEIEENDLGHDNVDTAITRARLANACGKNGDTKRQAALLETCLPVLEKANHHDLVAILSNLGISCAANGDHARAKECFERALDMKEKEKGKDHIQLADVLVGLAEVHGNLQELPQQRACLERALKIKETAYGPDDGKVTVTLANLGSVCRRMGDAQSAKDVFERTLATKEKQYGPDHAQVALTLANLAAAYGDLGDSVKQRELVVRALTIFERAHGPDHPHTQLAKKMIAKIDKKSQEKSGNLPTPQSSRSSLGRGAK